MAIDLQLWSILISFLYGIFIYFIIIFHSKLLKKNNIIKLFLNLLFVYIIILIYVLMIYFINKGIFHLYFLFLILGGYLLSNMIVKYKK
jgi:hypothetical protein